MLKEVTEKASDPKSFRIPEASKGATYSCEWGSKEDGMLCLGIVRHGYGAWVQIRDDADLALGDKFFLEEHRVEKKEERNKGDEKSVKSPGAVHLVRRADYLLSVLKDKTTSGTNLAAKRAVENHHRNNKKNGMYSMLSAEKRASGSASPAPSSARKGHRLPDKHRHRSSIERRISHGDQNGHLARSEARHDRNHHGQSHHRRSNEHKPPVKDPLMWKFFKPVRASLEAVQGATKEGIPNKLARAKLLREELVNIGNFVAEQCADEEDNLDDAFW